MFFQSVPSFTLVLSLDIKYSSFYVLSACAGGLREIKKKKRIIFLKKFQRKQRSLKCSGGTDSGGLQVRKGAWGNGD